MEVMRVDLSGADEVAAALDVFFPGVALGSAHGGEMGFHLAAHSNRLGLDLIDIDIRGRDMSTRVEGTAGLMVSTAAALDGGMIDAGQVIDIAQPYATRAGLRSEYSLARSSSLSLDAEVMEAYLRKQVGGTVKGPFRLTGAAPKSQQHGVVWRALASTVGTAMRAGLAEDALLGPSMTDTVAAALLSCFPSNWVDTDHAPRSRATAAVRRARVFIEEHAHEPVTVNDIAEAARLSPRGLHAGFRSQIGMPPMTYLRQVRLEQARRSLLESDPADGGSVERIARAAGFAHMSRFAAAYREAYGEYPNQTLRS